MMQNHLDSGFPSDGNAPSFARRLILGGILATSLALGIAWATTARSGDGGSLVQADECHTLDAVKAVNAQAFAGSGAEPEFEVVEGEEARKLFTSTGGPADQRAKVSKMLLVGHVSAPMNLFVVAFDGNGCAFLAAMLNIGGTIIIPGKPA